MAEGAPGDAGSLQPRCSGIAVERLQLGEFATQVAYLVFRVERPFVPRRSLLSRHLLAVLRGSGHGPRLRGEDHRVRFVVFVGERSGHAGQAGYARPSDGPTGPAHRLDGLLTAVALAAASPLASVNAVAHE